MFTALRLCRKWREDGGHLLFLLEEPSRIMHGDPFEGEAESVSVLFSLLHIASLSACLSHPYRLFFVVEVTATKNKQGKGIT